MRNHRVTTRNVTEGTFLPGGGVGCPPGFFPAWISPAPFFCENLPVLRKQQGVPWVHVALVGCALMATARAVALVEALVVVVVVKVAPYAAQALAAVVALQHGKGDSAGQNWW